MRTITALSVDARRRARVRGACALGAALLAGGIALVRSATSSTPESPRATQAESAEKAPLSGLDAQPGDEHAYALTLQIELSAALSNLFDGARAEALTGTASTRVVGRLHELVLDRQTSLVTLEAPEVTAQGARLSTMEAALVRGVLVERTTGGQIASVRTAKGADGEAIAMLRELAVILQWSRPPEGARSWTAREQAVEGTIEARYALDEGGRFRKEASRLVEPTIVPAPLPLPASVSVDLHGQVEPGTFALLRLAGTRSVTRTAASGAPFVRGVAEVTLARARSSRDEARARDVAASRDDYFDAPARLGDPLPTSPRSERGVLERLAAGRSTGELVSLVQRAATDVEAKRVLETSLRAFLILHPEACREIARAAASSSLAHSGARTVVYGLVASGHAEAQRALVELGRAWRGTGETVQLLPSLAALAAPNRDTEAFLRGLRAEPGASADLLANVDITLGTVAAHVQKDDPARADAIAEELERRVVATTAPAALAPLLAALGNTASERIRDVAPAYLTSEDTGVRRMAVYALGRLPDAEGRETLTEIAKGDSDAGVRNEAARALERMGG